ncbi:hypothetical protein GGI11_001149 [Coemansia sp. RSA 2049]|nr:hypothetical protein GGI11_001149 [Coemansia sp. RSA 2049]
MDKAPRSIELRSKGAFLMKIGAFDVCDIHTIKDLKMHLQDVTGIQWEDIVVWDAQTGTAFDDDAYEIPRTPAQCVFEVNILRVYFSFQHSRRSKGAHTAYVCMSKLVRDECVGHGIPLENRAIMHGWYFVSLSFDTFESVEAVNGDIFHIDSD